MSGGGMRNQMKGSSKVMAKATTSCTVNTRRRSVSAERSIAEMLDFGNRWPR